MKIFIINTTKNTIIITTYTIAKQSKRVKKQIERVKVMNETNNDDNSLDRE